ncbi:MAG: hypothetical protein EHM91_13480, partial [Planctomycetota bacterium]
MTKSSGIALAIVVLLLAAVQHWGLERQPETVVEAPMKNLRNIPASQALPTYIASLFFGAFRAVAVDILWIQLRKVEEEKRWYERREIIQMISYVQPRNPEVWSHLGWHSAYNVANGFTDPNEAWEWVKFGLLWLRRGIGTLPQEPYLKEQLAYTLWHKAAWRDGDLDMDLLKRIENDAELQSALLPDGMKSDRPLSAFELALPLLERARNELLDRDIKLTQMGLYLYPDTMDGFARMCMILQGMYQWKLGRPEEAKVWFVRAQKQVEDMLSRQRGAPPREGFEKRYRNDLSPIFKDWAEMYKSYPEIVDLTEKAKSKKPEDLLAQLALVQGLLVRHGPIDEHWLWSRYNPFAPLNALKQKLSDDTQECNDSIEMGSEISPGDLAVATLAPEGLDVDYYWIGVPPPDDQSPRQPARPMTLKFIFKRPAAARLDLKVTLFDRGRRPLKEEVLDPKAVAGKDGTVFAHQVSEYGRYFLKVEPADPSIRPWP